MRLILTSLVLAVLAAAAVGAAGCEPPIPDYAYPGGCDMDGGVCGMQGGGGIDPATSSSSSGGGGAGGSSGSNVIQGTVSLVSSPCFTQPGAAYNGVANVLWQATSGAAATASPYGGTNAMTFDFTGVPSPGVWMYVQDTSMGGAGILSTLSYWALPQVAGIQIPVIDAGMFSAIASMQPAIAQTGGLNTAASHVVLQLTQNGTPYAGLTVTSGSGSAVVAYDTGGCSYGGTTSTGTGGTIILFNSGLSGPVTITVMDTTTMQTFPLPTLLTAQGAVTLATAALD